MEGVIYVNEKSINNNENFIFAANLKYQLPLQHCFFYHVNFYFIING